MRLPLEHTNKDTGANHFSRSLLDQLARESRSKYRDREDKDATKAIDLDTHQMEHVLELQKAMQRIVY
jgi:hypothetical protein